MNEELLVQLAILFFFGIGALWISWKVRMPAILLLLSVGFLAGYFGLINPDDMLGEMLLPFVSVSVAIILFEGGLSLKVKELSEVGGVVRNLISIGALVTWVISAAAGHYLIGLNLEISLLLGAILVVSGPTVIMPILRNVRPSRRVGSILRWEAIVIDPIGAMFAAVVYLVILTQAGGSGETVTTLETVLLMIAVGTLLGVIGAGAVVILFRRFWVPDYLKNPVTLMILVTTYVASNYLESESGLYSSMIMGIALANQRSIPVKGIVAFKEDLSIMLLSFLFILLAATIKPHHFADLNIYTFLFIFVLIFVARPLAVFLSTIGSGMATGEKLFLAFMNPRGIVAAAVSSLFAVRLAEAGVPQADRIVPLAFFTIVITVAFYGLLATPLARAFKVAKKKADGFLIVGAHAWGREIAKALTKAGQTVLLVDSNTANIAAANAEGLNAVCANAMCDDIEDTIELSGLGRLLAITANSDVNALVCLHFHEIFERSEVFQLAPQRTAHGLKQPMGALMMGRPLFASGVTYRFIESRFDRKARITRSVMNERFTFKNFKESYGKRTLPLFIISGDTVEVCTAGDRFEPRIGDQIIHLYDPLPPGKKQRGVASGSDDWSLDDPDVVDIVVQQEEDAGNDYQ